MQLYRPLSAIAVLDGVTDRLLADPEECIRYFNT
jgi:hypothetical protein